MNVYIVYEEYSEKFIENVKGIYYTRDEAIDAISQNHCISVYEARDSLLNGELMTDDEVMNTLKDAIIEELEAYGETDTEPNYKIKEVAMATWGVDDKRDESLIIDEDMDKLDELNRIVELDRQSIAAVETEAQAADHDMPTRPADFNYYDYMTKRF